jgi:hypothetical protein
LADQGADDTVAVLPKGLDQHRKARAALDQGADMAVSRASQKIAFPVTWNDAVLDFRRAIPDRDGIDDLPARLA